MSSNNKMKVLYLYKNMMRQAQSFTGYNFRNYALRRTRDAFRDNKSVTGTEQIEQLIRKGEENLAMMTRQAAVSQLYKEPKIVLEKAT